VVVSRAELAVTGMTCANCAAGIERAVNRKVKGILKASVNFAGETLSVEYVPSISSLADIAGAVKNAGYGVVESVEGGSPGDAEAAAREAEIRDQTVKFLTGAAFALPLFILSMSRDFGLLGA